MVQMLRLAHRSFTYPMWTLHMEPDKKKRTRANASPCAFTEQQDGPLALSLALTSYRY